MTNRSESYDATESLTLRLVKKQRGRTRFSDFVELLLNTSTILAESPCSLHDDRVRSNFNDIHIRDRRRKRDECVVSGGGDSLNFRIPKTMACYTSDAFDGIHVKRKRRRTGRPNDCNNRIRTTTLTSGSAEVSFQRCRKAL